VPHRLQEDALLWVDVIGLELRDAEEQRVELVDIAQEAAPLGVRLARGGRVGVEVPLVVPPVRGDLLDAVAPVAEVAPELPLVVGLRVAAAHADDRDVGIVGAPLRDRRPAPGDVRLVRLARGRLVRGGGVDRRQRIGCAPLALRRGLDLRRGRRARIHDCG
jgi:hypothetical protein